MSINERLYALREVMRREKIDAFIFPSTDPHNGEYVPDHWKGREWISGFNGSAGTAVVTMEAAALWTDSRYFLAAEEQLAGTEFQLMKMKMSGTPSITQWLAQKLAVEGGTAVGVDGMVNAAAEVESLIDELRRNGGITVRTNFDPLRELWHDRPSIPDNRVEVYPLEFAGESAQNKLQRIREALKAHHAQGMLVTALDDIAWTLNLRGSDVHCNPVAVCYLLICEKSATLYINNVKLDDNTKNYLRNIGVDTDDYENVANGISRYDGYSLLMDDNEVNYTLFKSARCQQIIRAASPIPYMKAQKNATEIAGFKAAMLRDGVAMVKFLKWLKPAVEAGGQTEMSLDEKLTSLRAEQPLFRGISFDSIFGYAHHGAIVHYEATPETDIAVEPRGLLLMDTGAQYLDGTTDITRTVALGDTTPEQRHAYTLVLKGHIALAMAKFPERASGTQLDILARQAMWREGMNYMHGTGHGVGSYLNVHEGPHQIRMEWKPAPLVAGMTVTNEPGLYLAGKFGVRTENTMLITPYMETDFGRFLQLDPLTLCPIDTAPIEMEMMTAEEIQWLNNYHQMVFDSFYPHLDDEEREWLREACKAILSQCTMPFE
ncbi:MAG: aminopeptidase P family protein [Prevotella sp.]|nr:aminopeptidase P family protein [Prevotella sp.]